MMPVTVKVKAARIRVTVKPGEADQQTDQIVRYLYGHPSVAKILGTGEDFVLIQVPEEWAEDQVARLASGLFASRIEEVYDVNVEVPS